MPHILAKVKLQKKINICFSQCFHFHLQMLNSCSHLTETKQKQRCKSISSFDYRKYVSLRSLSKITAFAQFHLDVAMLYFCLQKVYLFFLNTFIFFCNISLFLQVYVV